MENEFEYYLKGLKAAYNNIDKSKIISVLDIGMSHNFSNEQNIILSDFLEKKYVDSNTEYLTYYLFLINHKVKRYYLAKYYFSICINTEEKFRISNELFELYYNKLVDNMHGNWFKNNSNINYNYNNEIKEYKIFSFSDIIGKNMTLLKTPYGDIIFDCGAGNKGGTVDIIQIDEFLAFLKSCGSSIDQIVAVFISHAHLDHYGSLSTLINAGIDMSKIFIDSMTKRLINATNVEMFCLDEILPPQAFYVDDNKIIIEPFSNGHILGSKGFIVHFDNINIVYTGDFCLHDQESVNGLNLDEILNNRYIQEYGINSLIIESTYGNQPNYIEHFESKELLLHMVNLLLDSGYKIIMPAFAIGRSQELAYILKNVDAKVVVDGQSVSVTTLYESVLSIRIFDDKVRYVSNYNDCDKNDNITQNDIIVASSGMLVKGSTSANYVKSVMEQKNKVAILLTGYMDNSEESYGRDILDEWKLYNRPIIKVPLSAHANYGELVETIDKLKPHNIITVHGNGIDSIANCMSLKRIINWRDNYIERIHNNSQVDNLLSSGKENEVIEKNDRCIDQTISSNNKDSNSNLTLDKEKIYIDEVNIKNLITNVVDIVKQCVDNSIPLKGFRPLELAISFVFKELKYREKYLPLLAYSENKSIKEKTEIILDCYDNDYVFSYNREDIVDNNEKNNQKKNKKIFSNVDSKYYSDIMIVKMSDFDYYVSQKIQGGVVYRKLLDERNATSNHFSNYESAYKYALLMQTVLLKNAPSCEIMDIDYYLYANDHYDEYIEDNYGNKLFGISNYKKHEIHTIEYTEYKYINVDTYRKTIDKLIYENEEKEFNLDNIGKLIGYKFAKEANLRYLRYEIYKAEELIKIEQSFPTIYDMDIIVLQNKIKALNESLILQQSLRMHQNHWKYFILNPNGEFRGLPNTHGVVQGLGDYDVIYIKSISEIKNPDDNMILVLSNFSSTNKDEIKMLSEVKIQSVKSISTKKTVKPEIVIPKFYVLGEGDNAYSLSYEEIPKLRNMLNEEDFDEKDIL